MNKYRQVPLLPQVALHFEEGDFYLGVDLVQGLLRDSNVFIDHAKPWLLVKDPQARAALDVTLHAALEVVRIASIMLQPVIPGITDRVLTKLSVEQRNWADAEVHREDEVALGNTTSVVFTKLKTS